MFFLEFLFGKQIFVHHFIPKERQKRHVANRGFVICISLFFS